jgi:hypothetical protein
MIRDAYSGYQALNPDLTRILRISSFPTSLETERTTSYSSMIFSLFLGHIFSETEHCYSYLTMQKSLDACQPYLYRCAGVGGSGSRTQQTLSSSLRAVHTGR